MNPVKLIKRPLASLYQAGVNNVSQVWCQAVPILGARFHAKNKVLDFCVSVDVDHKYPRA
ncbi:MAG: hypothetical protein GY819_18290 [Planctomycetaceae bacterium]|nr:hypothetical protein [Planctomycetaceae bacterium]